MLTKAIEAGASGVITKGKRAASLVKAVRAAANDEPVITPDALRRLMPHLGRRSHKIGDDLTSREREVLGLLVAGKSTAALAGELFVAQATARNHVQSIMNKLGAHSRLEAVAIADSWNRSWSPVNRPRSGWVDQGGGFRAGQIGRSTAGQFPVGVMRPELDARRRRTPT